MKMVRNFILLLFLLLFGQCNLINNKRGRAFVVQDLSRVDSISRVDESGVTIIKVKEPLNNQILSTDLIEDFFYVPLETTDESLFGYCTQLEIFDDKIYLFDQFSTQSVFIFDRTGKFIKRLGEKGGAPFEFQAPKGMAIDRVNKQLIIYDNQKRVWMYFTLTGEYIKKVNVPFRMKGSFQLFPSGHIVSATNKGDWNTHLGAYTDYRLLYTDTTGNIVKAVYPYLETEYSDISYPSLLFMDNEILYFPLYLNEIYQITDSTIKTKYRFDYADFTPFEKEKMGTFESSDDFEAYVASHAYLTEFSENETHISFITNKKDGKKFITFLDKRSGNSVSFTNIHYDMDFIFNFNPYFSSSDYFIAALHPSLLKGLKQYINKTSHYPAKEYNMRLFEDIKDDDNMVLVFFKIKDL